MGKYRDSLRREETLRIILWLLVCLFVISLIICVTAYYCELLQHIHDCMIVNFVWWLSIEILLLILPFIILVLYCLDISISLMLPCIGETCLIVEKWVAMITLCFASILFTFPLAWTILGSILLSADASCIKETSTSLYNSSIIWIVVSYILSVALIPFGCCTSFYCGVFGMCFLDGGDGEISRGYGKHTRTLKSYHTNYDDNLGLIDVVYI